MSTSLTLAARLTLDAQRWTRGLASARTGLRGFTADAKNQMASLRNAMSTVQGRLAAAGIGFSAAAVAVKSAHMDQDLTRIQQMAGLSAEQVRLLRTELYRMGRDAGTDVDQLQEGFTQLAAGGLDFDKALPTIQAINRSMAVTGSQAGTLSDALMKAQEFFGFDLSKAGQAQMVLDKMTVAGRAGVIELEDLSGAFASAANSSKAAGLSFDQTLALFEGLGTATTKDRLGTLVDSTLRVFTNANYMKAAQKATGVRFFNAKNERRDALEVIADIKRKFDTLRNDKQRSDFINAAFGKADLDTQKGIQAAMRDGKLEKILAITGQVQQAAGATAKDYPQAIANAVSQSQRLKNTLGEAGDRLAQPINAAIARASAFALNDTKDGGLQMSGGDLLKVGGAGLGVAFLLKQFGGRALSSLGGKIFGTASGVAQGKALEAAAGVTPVFVTNAADIGGGGLGGAAGAIGGGATAAATKRALAGLLPRLALIGGSSVGSLATAGAAGAGTLAAGVGAAGLAGAGAGRLISETVLQRGGMLGSESGAELGNKIGQSVAAVLALVGNKEAQAALAQAQRIERAAKLKGELVISINAQGQASVTRQAMNSPGVALRTNTGRMMKPTMLRAGRE